jgi:gluconate 2-dehydrogenase alpha chain
MFFDDKILNPFIGAGGLGQIVDDWNGENFDHAGLGFTGGGTIGLFTTNGRPILGRPTPPGTPRWGSAWKQATKASYLQSATIGCQGSSQSARGNFLDLDPSYVDRHGRRLLRMTFDFPAQDLRMSDFLTAKAAAIARAMRPRQIVENPRRGPYSMVPYQTTHNTGGAIMGSDPRSSAVNRYLQSWDVPNLFVIGASAFPQNAGYNPTGTVAALAYWSAAAIRTQYLKSPGPLA